MKKKTVSLVLGGGAAKGLAHIGVIKYLTENGYDIRSISGTSMGALIGGVYAMGKLDEYTHWVIALERLDVVRMLDFSFGRNGLFKGDRIISTLKKLIGDANIENLPISYTAVATDLKDEKEVRFNDGSLFDAIRASIAIPGIFTPHNYRGKTFIDGSLVSPVPIEPTLKDDTDLTIAVNLNPKPNILPTINEIKEDEENNTIYHQQIIDFINSIKQQLGPRSKNNIGMFDIIYKSMSMCESTIAQWQLEHYSPDLIIEIPRDSCSFYEFHRASEMIELGYLKTEDALVLNDEISDIT